MITDASEIRDALERIVGSEAFATSPTLAAFLRYVVEETLAGRGDRLKAYSIAVAALGRPSDFDPNDNPLVRVQARRLRAALARHYTGAGAGDPLRIDLPIGGYVPVFRPADDGATAPLASPPPASTSSDPDGICDEADAPRSDLATGIETTAAPGSVPPAPTPAPTPAPRSTGPLRRRLVIGVAVVLVFAAVGLALLFADRLSSPDPGSEPEPEPPQATRTAPIDLQRGLTAARVLPQLVVEVETRGPVDDRFDPDLYRRRLEGFALRFDDLVVVTRRSPLFPPQPGQPLYVLRVTVTREGASIDAHYQLQHAVDERLLVSRATPLGQDMFVPKVAPSTEATPTDLSVMRELIDPFGPIWADLATTDDIAKPLACLVTSSRYDIDVTAQTLHRARACLGPVVAEDPDLVPALLRYVDVLVYEYRRGLTDRPADALGEAERFVARALALAPTSAAPFRRLEHLLLLRGDGGGAVAAGRRALEFNPYDIAAIGDHGTVLASLGRYTDAIPYLRRALSEMPAQSQRFLFYAFLALDCSDRPDEADRYAARLIGTESPLFRLAVAIRADRLHDGETALAVLRSAETLDPQFAENRRAALLRRGLVPAVVDRFLRDVDRIDHPPVP